MPIALVAIGGNALIPEREAGLPSEQLAHARECALMFARIIQAGHALCVVHGNGPQVGNLLVQQDAAAGRIPPYALDIADAMTQGSMGYMLERELLNRLRSMGLRVPVTTVLTEVIVDAEDPAFQHPTKPVGPFYAELRARQLMRQKGWRMVEDAGRGWRKVVPSPRPISIVQMDAIRHLLAEGHCVIAGGGGGIPVVEDPCGQLEGVEAVIDKDRLSALLAERLKAETYVILTGVPKVALDFGRPTQRWLDHLSIAEAERYQAEGQFPPGSMGPKIEAALRFLRQGGREVLITDPKSLAQGPYESIGTRVTV
ncbi:MAG: carbamate kinase [Holophagaceae bacterium]|nr:carbamate kinase [Holophagaceae bacterium]